MAVTASIRSLGQAGLFTLSVLRGSRPSRDLFAELVREIYKVGARSLPIITVGGAFVGWLSGPQARAVFARHGLLPRD